MFSKKHFSWVLGIFENSLKSPRFLGFRYSQKILQKLHIIGLKDSLRTFFKKSLLCELDEGFKTHI